VDRLGRLSSGRAAERVCRVAIPDSGSWCEIRAILLISTIRQSAQKFYGCTSTYLWLNDYCGILFQFDSKYVFKKLKFFAVLGPRTWCNVKSGMPSFTSICAMSRPCGAKNRKNCPE